MRCCFLLLLSGVLVFTSSADTQAQILSYNIIDLRTKIKGHRWSFHPGDSPILVKEDGQIGKYASANEYYEEEGETPRSRSIAFAWAQPVLKGADADGWVGDIPIQTSWMRYRDKKGDRPFRDFEAYYQKYKGYGWYRTSFLLTREDVESRIKSYDLEIRLGKIGQCDAVYLNGSYVGGTGLMPDTPQGAVLGDEKLKYDKIRYYRLPRELLKLGKENVLAVRVFAKYPIAPGLSHDRYYIASMKKQERSKFWDDFKKIFVIVLSSILGLFYLYWFSVFRKEESSTIYFALASFFMAINTFMQSQIVYSIMNNGLWIKKLEFISFIMLAHLVLEFFSHFAHMKSRMVKFINRFWDLIGVAAVITIVFLPTLVSARRFMFVWAAAPLLLFLYMVYIFIKGRNIPSMGYAVIGFLGMVLMLVNDVLVGFQFRWVKWEFSLQDYAFAFFGLMVGGSIVTNMKKSRDLIEQQKEEKKRLSKYFSPEVVDQILQGRVTLGGEEKQVVTLFADVVGFTSFSESREPAEVVSRLNRTFSQLSGVVFKYSATLDKYIGDCIMAFWGAPKSTPMDAYNAISCAMDMQKTITEIEKVVPDESKRFRLRIGINYGPSIVGNIGSYERMDYTVIGDAVNTASRIESNGIPGRVAISESTFLAAGGDQYIKYSEIREIQVKGKAQPLKIYIVDEVLPRKAEDSKEVSS